MYDYEVTHIVRSTSTKEATCGMMCTVAVNTFVGVLFFLYLNNINYLKNNVLLVRPLWLSALHNTFERLRTFMRLRPSCVTDLREAQKYHV